MIHVSFGLCLADNKGRWWIIGSAWKGDEQKNTQNVQQKKDKYDKKILEMAKKYRMNTDTRKNIFCILFTAEVYNIHSISVFLG